MEKKLEHSVIVAEGASHIEALRRGMQTNSSMQPLQVALDHLQVVVDADGGPQLWVAKSSMPVESFKVLNVYVAAFGDGVAHGMLAEKKRVANEGPDLASVFDIAKSLEKLGETESERYDGHDEYTRECMRVASEFEEWADNNLDFSGASIFWPYEIGDLFVDAMTLCGHTTGDLRELTTKNNSWLPIFKKMDAESMEGIVLKSTLEDAVDEADELPSESQGGKMKAQ
jgi:hypothetical protein